MPHHCIKYRLNPDGTVPSFLCLHPEGVGGVFVVPDPSTPSPRDMVMIGISESDDTGDAEVISSKEDLKNYLISVGVNWRIPDPSSPQDPLATLPFDPIAASDWVWTRLDALNQ